MLSFFIGILVLNLRAFNLIGEAACEIFYITFEVLWQVTFLDHVKQNLGMLLGKINLKRLFAPSTIGAV